MGVRAALQGQGSRFPWQGKEVWSRSCPAECSQIPLPCCHMESRRPCWLCLQINPSSGCSSGIPTAAGHGAHGELCTASNLPAPHLCCWPQPGNELLELKQGWSVPRTGRTAPGSSVSEPESPGHHQESSRGTRTAPGSPGQRQSHQDSTRVTTTAPGSP